MRETKDCPIWIRLPVFLVLVHCSMAARAQVVEAVAVEGEPWGVARVRIPVGSLAALDPDPRVEVREAKGRMLYPAVRRLESGMGVTADRGPDAGGRLRLGNGRLLARIGQVLRNANVPADERQTLGYEVLFLVAPGEGALKIDVDSPAVARLQVPLQAASPVESRALLERWWQAYREQTKEQIDDGDYPPLVETYLTEMLGSRLGLPTDEPPKKDEDEPHRLVSTLELFVGAERLQVEALKRSAAGRWRLNEEANEPLPEPPLWTPLPLQPSKEVPSIEPLARRVPPECFLLRFGNYENYQWFQDLSAEYGGDLAQMITQRGVRNGAAARLQERLNLKSSELARVFGPQIVDDMALIGHDLMLASGPAMGILFKCKNAFLLRTTLSNDRQKLLTEHPEARLSTVTLLGENVSLLDTPDHHLRSFWVDAGEYQFVTTSRYLAERFIAVGQGAPSLGDSPGYQYARRLLPEQDNWTVFAYFSNEFFQHLVSPEYLIETRRRLRAEADLTLMHLARWASKGEGHPMTTVNELIGGGYLPVGFGRRPDGSGPIVLDHDVLDSARGRRGSFVPVRDVPTEGVTAEEAAEYRDLADFYSKDWRQMDPLVAGIRRVVEESGRERLEVRAEIAPLVPDKYGWWARQLGPPTRTAIEFAPDDLVHLQAHVITDLLGGTIPPHHLFGALKDTEPPPLEAMEGVIRTYITLRGTPGYIGAWPLPGVLDRLPLGLGRGTPVGPDLSRLLGGVYRWQSNGFSVLSFMPEIIAASTPYLRVVDQSDSAQVRIHVGNLKGARLESWVNRELYQRSLVASLAGAEYLRLLSDQLGVPEADALDAAGVLLDGTLVDPLGGEYQLAADVPGLPARYRSSIWPKEPRIEHPPPAGYMAPPLRWFRGLDADLTQYPDRLVLSGEVIVQRREK